MTYIGPKGINGIVLKGTRQKPWEWKPEEIEEKLKQFPQYKKYFAEAKPKK